MLALETRARALIEEKILKDGPMFVVDFSLRGTKGSYAVDLFVESDEAMSVDQLAGLSREVGLVLEAEAAITGQYTLNVSSPGADRPIRLPRQYPKHVGRTLRVHFRKDSGDGYTEKSGMLVDANQSGICLEHDGRTTEIQYNDILWAKVVLPW